MSKDQFPSFFTNVDRIQNRPDRAPAAAFPAWYFESNIDEMRDQVEKYETQLKMGLIPPESVMYYKQECQKLRERISDIKASKVKLTDRQKDLLFSFYKKAGEVLADSMPTYTKMHKGLASARQEMKLNTEPNFGVAGFEDLLKALNITPRQGKVSRNELSIAWKIAARYLGNESNTEFLRKDNNFGTYQLDKTLEECEKS